MKFEIKENITVTVIPPPPKIAKNMLFHYGLIFKRTYLSKCLMNNVISVLWRHHTRRRQNWATCFKGWRGTVAFWDWWFRALSWIVCKNRWHVPLMFIEGSAEINNKINILMAGQLVNSGWGNQLYVCTWEQIAVFLALWLTFLPWILTASDMTFTILSIVFFPIGWLSNKLF